MNFKLLARNPLDAVEPPRAERKEMQALDEDDTASLLGLLKGSRLHTPVFLAVTTGLRRGELLGLRWSDVDLKTRTLTVVQSLEQTKDGLKFKAPKTHRSRRSIALPAMTVEVLRSHRVAQAEEKLALGPAWEEHGLVVVSERLGHSGVGITLDTYSHVMPGLQEDAAGRIDGLISLAISRLK